MMSIIDFCRSLVMECRNIDGRNIEVSLYINTYLSMHIYVIKKHRIQLLQVRVSMAFS